MKKLLLTTVLFLYFSSSSFALSETEVVSKYNLVSESGSFQNIDKLTTSQLQEVIDTLNWKNRSQTQNDILRKATLDDYITYYRYIKEDLWRYPGSNQVIKKNASTRDLENYNYSKLLPLVTKLSFKNIDKKGLVEDINTRTLQLLLPNLWEAQDSEITWKYEKHLNLPILPEDEELYLFVNKEQTKVAGCVKLEVSWVSNDFWLRTIYAWKDKLIYIVWDFEILPENGLELCEQLNIKKIIESNVISNKTTLTQLLNKQLRIMQSNVLFNRYFNQFTKSYTKELNKKSLTELKKLNFMEVEAKLLKQLEGKSENTKRVKLVQLYALEKVVNNIILTKQENE